MFTDTKVQKELLPTLMTNTLAIALDLFETQTSKSVLDKLAERSYELLYCEETQEIYDCQEEKEINGLPCCKEP